MDYTTSHIFFLVSLGLFTIALFSLALVDRSVVGTRWLAASTLIDFTKTLLQELNGHLPRFVTVCVANELNILAFLAMYLGLRWFVVRKPFGGWVWLLPVAAVMADLSDHVLRADAALVVQRGFVFGAWRLRGDSVDAAAAEE